MANSRSNRSRNYPYTIGTSGPRIHVGKLTLREFSLGSVEYYGDPFDDERNGKASIFMEHGTFAVRGFDPKGRRYAVNFKTLTKARKFADDIVKGKVK